METQNLPHKEKTFFREYGAILISCIFLIVTLLYGYLTGIAIDNKGHTSHLLTGLLRQIPYAICMLFLGVMWIFVIVALSGRGISVQKLIVGFLIVIASGILSLSLFARIMIAPFTVRESIKTDTRAYYLTYNPGALGDPGWYILDECNLTGITCRVLYTSDNTFSFNHDDAELNRDSDAQIISVLIDGQLVYTHPLE